ncbi:hypothetical protein DYBT9275_01054 [Dyadobacter sp. CECT 9275]|uniref:Lipocalin-like domain-containing protein n=1 Tax=Dyadobacter helix TaxID=2822344 RepID=A0A916J9S9_9BACT|nr:lipocalin family protein [Dyadobacter sp. CECT 9275]CAG4992852.1 hypothetical protein DYBT9275_01054 [Dyadobacter sp. CECT 9275]
MKIRFGLIILTSLAVSCGKESGSISGSWVRDMDEQPQFKQGFTLKDDGSALAINQLSKTYETWEKQGNLLIITGKETSQEPALLIRDTLKIISVSDSTLILENAGQRHTFSRTANPTKAVENFETFSCYTYTFKKDTAFMKLNITDTIVTGDLEYSLFEKDKNDGKLKGTLNGDTLWAAYSFISEGVESTREMVFLRKGDDWLEGFGKMEDKAGTSTFADKNQLRFRKGLLFKRTECP